MRLNRFKFNLVVFYVFSISFFSYLVATRDIIAGTDARVYQDYFLNMEYYKVGNGTFELGYHYFNYLVFQLSNSYKVFLFLFYLVFNIVYIKSLSNFIYKKNNSFYLSSFIIFLALILLSSWYQNATLNALRQGFSLALLYLSFSYLFLESKSKFIFYLILACGFHNSTLLVLPFLLLFYFQLKNVFLVFLVFSIFYPLGINEILISYVSSLVGLPLYEDISSYSENNEAWKGFQLSFYAYSFFWCCLFSIVHYKYYKDSKSSDFILKTILILTSFYFLLGFGSFSNRFGFAAWLFLPIIQTFYLVKLGSIYIKNIYVIIMISISILFIGFLNYYFILRPIS